MFAIGREFFIGSKVRFDGLDSQGLISSFPGQSTGWVETHPNPSLLVWEYRTVHQQRRFFLQGSMNWFEGKSKPETIDFPIKYVFL